MTNKYHEGIAGNTLLLKISAGFAAVSSETAQLKAISPQLRTV